MIEKPKWTLGDGISQSTRRIFEQLIDGYNTHESAIAKLTERVAVLDDQRVRIAILEKGIWPDGLMQPSAFENLAKRIEALEIHTHTIIDPEESYGLSNPRPGSALEPKAVSAGAGNEKGAASGHWVCAKCGKDWGVEGHEYFTDDCLERHGAHRCQEADEGCGTFAVKWVPYSEPIPVKIDPEVKLAVETKLQKKMQQEPSELKLCPFCDGAKIEVQQVDMEDREGLPICRVCPDCGATGPWKYTKGIDDTAGINAAWNRRPEGDRLRAELKKEREEHIAAMKDLVQAIEKRIERYEEMERQMREYKKNGWVAYNTAVANFLNILCDKAEPKES